MGFGCVGCAGDGTADATMAFTGKAADVNAALNGLGYKPATNYNGPETLTLITNDQGNTGSGGAKSDTDTVAITVTAVNDAPVNVVPVAQATNEDTAKAFSAGGGNPLSVSDVDVAETLGGKLLVTLSVSHGTLSLSGTTGLGFGCVGCAGDGTADATMAFTGTAADVNAALNGLVYLPASNYNGADTLTLITNDQGNTGSGGAKSDTDTVAITVNAVNDAPVNSVPGPQVTNEDTSKTFSSGGGNALSVSDVDVAETVGGKLLVTLSVSHGSLTLSGTSGLVFTTGDGTADATMAFTGTAADVNAALNGLVYSPAAHYDGPETLTLITNDQGNTGSGGALSDTDTVAITVTAVNDAPVNSVPGAQVTNEDTSKTFSSGGGNALSVSDVDVAETVGGKLLVTLSVSHGTLSLSGTTGLSFSCVGCAGDGTADATMAFTGTAADVTAALNGLVYSPAANYNGAETLTLITDDQGNTGSGGAKSDTDTVAITVNAVNDAPVNVVPVAQATNEDTAKAFSAGGGNALSVSDVDVAETLGGKLLVTLSVSHGTLSLSGTTGLGFGCVGCAGDGTADATMAFTGTAADVNAALNGLVYLPASNYNGADTLTLITDDQGNTGSGGALSDTDMVAITVNAVNDAPVNVVPVAQATNEDTSKTFSSGGGNALSVSDVDVAETLGGK